MKEVKTQVFCFLFLDLHAITLRLIIEIKVGTHKGSELTRYCLHGVLYQSSRGIDIPPDIHKTFVNFLYPSRWEFEVDGCYRGGTFDIL